MIFTIKRILFDVLVIVNIIFYFFLCNINDFLYSKFYDYTIKHTENVQKFNTIYVNGVFFIV